MLREVVVVVSDVGAAAAIGDVAGEEGGSAADVADAEVSDMVDRDSSGTLSEALILLDA